MEMEFAIFAIKWPILSQFWFFLFLFPLEPFSETLLGNFSRRALRTFFNSFLLAFQELANNLSGEGGCQTAGTKPHWKSASARPCFSMHFVCG